MPVQTTSSSTKQGTKQSSYSRWLPSLSSTLMTCVGMILVMSLLMVASASIPFAQTKNLNEFRFFYSQAIYILLGLGLGTLMYFVPLRRLFRTDTAFVLMLVSLVMILYTVIGGTFINGSKRWIELGFANFQPAELAKFAMILFAADFLVRRVDEVRYQMKGFFRLAGILTIMVFAIMLQPDFGSVVMIVGTVAAMIFVAGLPMRLVMALAGMLATATVLAITMASYRIRRVTSFLDPFDDLRDTDYQLGRSIVAFARGEWTGVGYGESIQKLSHLPEAHTDFLLAITGEELGFFGVSFLLILEIIMIWVIMKVSYDTLKRRQGRLSYFAFGVGVLFFGQVFINAGMTMGLLPTKGLTMPFFSFGGSSMVINLMMMGVLLRVMKDSPKIAPSDSRYY
ncbi:putative lipid II flippase FtsW [Faucicola mancuniensis]|uniref:putative lipid II flippase FtsW n=1 Tax=Faucicola mancuniensis TaxID=1309795 RepID=UPI0028EC494B|nr:putative lipid II flippase FtsW [uncultured Moraxella sp.]